MGIEVEISYNLGNQYFKNEMPMRSKVIKRLKKMGAKKEGKYIFKVMKFTPPNGLKNDTLRIRDEGRYVTMTYKRKDVKSGYNEENEVIIDNFEMGVEFVKKMGAKENYFYEKLREVWRYKNTEITFDDSPAIPTIMEIESKVGSEKDIYRIAKKLGFDKKNEGAKRSSELYKELYGFEVNELSIPYEKMKSILGKLCKKNKNKMNKIIKSQIKEYKKIKSQSKK